MSLKKLMLATVAIASLLALQAPSRAATPSLLPSGMFSTSGTQIVSASTGTPVRLACAGMYGLEDPLYGYSSVNDAPFFSSISTSLQAMAAAGFNCLRISITEHGFHDSGNMLSLLDGLVSAAGTYGLRVIINNHNDEGGTGGNSQADKACVPQQANGIWYDEGGNSNNTDGCVPNDGTITNATYQTDMNSLASRYAGNNTVIAYELGNELLSPNNTSSGPGSTWGDGGPSDVAAMATSVGSSMLAYDSSKLILVPCPFNGGYPETTNITLYDGTTQGAAPWGDCTGVKAHPVNFTVNGSQVTNKTAYVVHLYPNSIAGESPDQGAGVLANFNKSWGFLYTSNIAPVIVTEIGDPLATSDDTTWAPFVIAYLNGQDGAQGGPTFTGSQQPISTTWWSWTANPNLAILNSDGSLNTTQKGAWSQLLYYPASVSTQPPAISGLPTTSAAVVGTPFDLPDVTVTDPTGGALQVQIVASNHAIINTNGCGAGSGINAVTINGTPSQIAACLPSVTISDNTAETTTVTYKVTDSANLSTSQYDLITFAATASGPVITMTCPASASPCPMLLRTTTTFTPGTVADSASGNYSATVTVSGNAQLNTTASGWTGSGTQQLAVGNVSLSSLNAGLALARFTGYTQEKDTVTLSVTDPNSAKSSAVGYYSVAASAPPVISAPVSISGSTSGAVSISPVQVSDGSTGGTFAFSASATGHATLSMTGATGNGTSSISESTSYASLNANLATLTITDTTAETVTVTLSLTDGGGKTATPAKVTATLTTTSGNCCSVTFTYTATQDSNGDSPIAFADIGGTLALSAGGSASPPLTADTSSHTIQFVGNWGAKPANVCLGILNPISGNSAGTMSVTTSNMAYNNNGTVTNYTNGNGTLAKLGGLCY